jgi:hypothetical protein
MLERAITNRIIVCSTQMIPDTTRYKRCVRVTLETSTPKFKSESFHASNKILPGHLSVNPNPNPVQRTIIED